MGFNLEYKKLNNQSILIEWPNKIDNRILSNILSFKQEIKKHKSEQILYLNSSYCSILVYYKKYISDIQSIIRDLKDLYGNLNKVKKTPKTLWKIPVCYDDNFGLDFNYLEQELALTKSEIIELHCKPIYTIYFIGFLPGFMYLGGLDTKLHVPRKNSPRPKVESGSVAIGGQQTGIYPSTSPGGWQIIGNSPLIFFDNDKKEPCFFKAGDQVQFRAVNFNDYKAIQNNINEDNYTIESEPIND